MVGKKVATMVDPMAEWMVDLMAFPSAARSAAQTADLSVAH